MIGRTCLVVVATVLAAEELAAWGQTHTHPEENRHPPPKVIAVPEPETVLTRLVDPRFARRVRSVRLKGTLDGAGTPSPVEEIGIWPDRLTRRTGAGNGLISLRLSPRALFVAGGGEPTPAIRGLARARLRGLFVLRHFAEAAARRQPSQRVFFARQVMGALEARDSYGPFRIIFGGVTGGLQGIETDEDRLYFLAFARSGSWMYPATQVFENGGSPVEVLRVTEASTEPPY